jgi:hypothetical protein
VKLNVAPIPDTEKKSGPPAVQYTGPIPQGEGGGTGVPENDKLTGLPAAAGETKMTR